MPSLRWVGEPPAAPLRASLEALGYRLGPSAQVTVVRTARATVPPAPPSGGAWVWVSSAALSTAAVLEAAARGAYDAVCLQGDGEKRLLSRLRELKDEAPVYKPPPGFIAESAAGKALLARLHQAARTSMPVLLTGETGTGKELAARLIHQLSTRRQQTFVPINCAAMPNELMEAELFGYVKGAFSGAVRDYDGQLVAAEGGTVFLDEIDDTPLPLQVKLLRVLEDRVVSRLGENVWRKVDFRILAATNRDLRPLIAQGAFGADVYERLSTVTIELPPLRERQGDLPALTSLLLSRFYAEETAPRPGRVTRVSAEALVAMQAYPWPGNVRELRNVIFGALVTKRAGDELLVSDLPARLLRREAAASGSGRVVNVEQVRRRVREGSFNLRVEREQLERVALTAALTQAGGKAAEAARLLGEVGRGTARQPGGTVRVMMKRLGLRRR